MIGCNRGNNLFKFLSIFVFYSLVNWCKNYKNYILKKMLSCCWRKEIFKEVGGIISQNNFNPYKPIRSFSVNVRIEKLWKLLYFCFIQELVNSFKISENLIDSLIGQFDSGLAIAGVFNRNFMSTNFNDLQPQKAKLDL